jgi:hypothetical protein
MYRDYDIKAIDDEWAARFMLDRQYKIENDLPFIDFDFESLTNSLCVNRPSEGL